MPSDNPGDIFTRCSQSPMPELPEVEFAVRELRREIRGRRILRAHAHHKSQRRTLTRAVSVRLRGRRVTDVLRRGKYQLLILDDRSTLVVHFRLDGAWEITSYSEELPAHVRVSIELDDRRVLSLTDPRALCTIVHHAPLAPPSFALGPEPEDPGLTPVDFRARLAGGRTAIKPALLDQKRIAGVGNIYASEACWHARIHPAAPSASLTLARVARLLAGLRTTLADGHVNAKREHRGQRPIPLEVYDREGEPCSRCEGSIRRISQSGRGTWFCPRCQRS